MTNLNATMFGNTLTVTTGINMTIEKGQRVYDNKTGDYLTFQGKVDTPTLKCPFMFLDEDLDTRRHSAKYIAKYITV